MILYTGLLGATAVLGSSRGWEVPFHVGCTGDERDVVEVADLAFINCELLETTQGD